jgi:hypothetical protein
MRETRVNREYTQFRPFLRWYLPGRENSKHGNPERASSGLQLAAERGKGRASGAVQWCRLGICIGIGIGRHGAARAASELNRERQHRSV